MSEPRNGTRRRLTLAGTVAALAFGVLASVGAALAPSGPAAAAKQYPKGKVTICHRTHSKKHPFVTIRVSVRALKAHLRHGDTLGSCNLSKLKKSKKGKHGHHGHHGHKGTDRDKGKPDNVGGRGKGKPDKAPGGEPDKAGRGKHK